MIFNIVLIALDKLTLRDLEDEDSQEEDANDQGENIALGQDEPWELLEKDDTYSAFMN